MLTLAVRIAATAIRNGSTNQIPQTTAQQTSFVTAALPERCADNFTHTCLERKVCRLICQSGIHRCV